VDDVYARAGRCVKTGSIAASQSLMKRRWPSIREMPNGRAFFARTQQYEAGDFYGRTRYLV